MEADRGFNLKLFAALRTERQEDVKQICPGVLKDFWLALFRSPLKLRVKE